MKRPDAERPIFPGNIPLKKISNERGVSPVIAVILMVAITVVLSAVLYVMVMELIKIEPTPPRGSLTFEEDDDNPGTYIGTFDGRAELDDIEFSVYDASEFDTVILRPSEETTKGLQEGLSITYKDINSNLKLDAIDMILIQGGAKGDKVTIGHGPSGSTVAQKELT